MIMNQMIVVSYQLSSKEIFQAVVTIQNYLLHYEQNIPEIAMHYKKLNEIFFIYYILWNLVIIHLCLRGTFNDSNFFFSFVNKLSEVIYLTHLPNQDHRKLFI